MAQRDSRQTRVLVNQFKRAINDQSPYIKYHMCADAAHVWYIVFHHIPGDENEFEGGEYLCKLEAPVDFPFSAPTFEFITPNGVFDTKAKPCIEIGHFHQGSYSATLGMSGFATRILGGLLAWKELVDSGGIAIINTTIEEKKRLAASSVAFNSNCPEYALVCETHAHYSK